MPSPDQMTHHLNLASQDRLAEFFKPAHFDLAVEVAALREEIAALRAELKPVPSLILTGQQVAAEFKRIAIEARGDK